jgi:hypothetical protein
MKRAAAIAVRLTWLAMCVMVLIDSHRAYKGSSDWKTEECLGFQMMILSFPVSYLVAGGLFLAGAGLGLFGLALPPSSKAEMTVAWLFLVVAGYAQWFLLLPKLFRSLAREGRPLCEGYFP